MNKDEEAQMLLLTAVIVVIGYLALAAVTDGAIEASVRPADQGQGVFSELTNLEQIALHIFAEADSCLSISAAIDHLGFVYGARGYSLTTGNFTAAAGTGALPVALSGTGLTAQFTITGPVGFAGSCP